MAAQTPFAPAYGQGKLITTTGVSQSVAVSKTAKTIHLNNYGATNACYVRIGRGTVTAVTTDLVVAPGERINVYKGEGDDTVAALQITGATTLSIIEGEGGI